MARNKKLTLEDVDQIIETIRNRLMEAIEKKHCITIRQWRCAKCSLKDKSIPPRLMLAIGDSEHPVAISTHTHCRVCGEYFGDEADI